MSERLKTAAVIAGAATARAGMTALTTIAWNHRALAHRSLEFSPVIQTVFDAEQRMASITPEEWAADHRRHHHQFPDADLFGFWKLDHAIRLAEDNRIAVPTRYSGLDRLVNAFTLEEVRAIGGMADTYLKNIMGEEYTPPHFSSTSDVEKVLNEDSPRYLYETRYFERDRVYTDEEAAHILLRDQHSPLLTPPLEDGSHNGVRYIWLHNTQLSRVPTQLYRQRPSLLPQDLRPDPGREPKSNAPSVKAGFVLAGLIALALSRDISVKGIAKAAAAGSFVNGFGLGILERGGATVNAFGHMGIMTPETLREAIFFNNFKITPNTDGSISSDTEHGGIIGKVMSLLTVDESGKQDKHHKFPFQIAYRDPKGSESWKEAPGGTLLERLADHPNVPFIKRGPGLPTRLDGQREDYHHPAIDIIHAARVRSMNEPAQAA